MILNHVTDKILKDSAPEVVIVKPGYFFETWLPALESIRADPPTFESPFYPADHKFPMVRRRCILVHIVVPRPGPALGLCSILTKPIQQISAQDIGEYCAKVLMDDSQGPSLRYATLLGPELYSTLDLEKAVHVLERN